MYKKITLNNILEDIKNNPFITQEKLASIYFCHERTIRRYIKILKDNNVLELDSNGRNKKWIIKNS